MELDRILELLAKQIGSSASESELIELEYLLQQNASHQHLVSILRSIQSKRLRQPAQNDELLVRQGWEKLQQKLNESQVLPFESEPQKAVIHRLFFKNSLKWKWAAVWIGIILLTGGLYYSLVNSKNAAITSTINEMVSNGKPEIKTLPDGSVVFINSGTQISYKTEHNTRDVYLQGEAYFKVKHDTEHPFVVHAGNIAVMALGTEFNVLAYPDEDHVETTLIKGKVQITMKEKPDQKIILTPNEKLTVFNKNIAAIDTAVTKEISYEVKPVQILPVINEAGEVAWMQDKLAFQNESFFTLAKKMERRFNVHIVFHDEQLKKETLSGVFENENIQKAMRVLQMTTPFQYHMKRDSIFLTRLLH